MRDRLLESWAALATRRPRTLILAAVLLAVLGGTWAALRLHLNANTDDLISPDRPYMVRYRAFVAEFGDLEHIYAVVAHRDDPARAEACVADLADRLRAIPGRPEVHHAILPADQRRVATRAMSDEELVELARVAGAFPALLDPGGTAALLDDARQRLRRLQVTGAVLGEAKREALGAAAIFELTLIASAVAGSEAAQEIDALIGGGGTPEYLRSDTGRLYFVEIKPIKDYGTLAVIEKPLADIRAVIDRVRADYPDLEIGLTGKPVLQADEMATSDADMTRASIIAIVLVGLLFMFVMRGIRRPLLALTALFIAIAWTFGLATVVVGQLNLLSVVFTLILVGIGIDFGVHVVARYGEELARRDRLDAIRVAVVTAGRGNSTGAITSGIAFFMALLTDFRGLQELGFIAGSGLLLCFLSMSLVLPALLAIFDPHGGRASVPPASDAGTGTAPRRRALLIGLALATLAGIPLLLRVSFARNILELQAEGLPSIEWEHRILEDSASATWFGAIPAADEAELLAAIERAQGEPTIGAVHSVFDVVRPTSAARERSRAALHVAADADAGPVTSPSRWASTDIHTAARELLQLARLAQEREPEAAQRLDRLARTLAGLAASVHDPRDADAQALKAAVDARVAAAADVIGAMLAGDRLPLRDALPDALRERYVATSGRLLLMAHPRTNLWDLTAMRPFVVALKRVSPDATGAPISHLESIADMERGFGRAALLALTAVFLVVLLDFRSLRPSLLAITPLALGGVWMLEVMGMLGLDFNLANFFAVPILIGIGVDNGIHIVHRVREGASPHDLGSTRRGVILTSLTTLIGFGCLALAHHRGLRSLGHVMAIGSATCLIASLFVLPQLCSWLQRRRGAPPVNPRA